MLKDDSLVPGKDYVLVDLRRTDFEVRPSRAFALWDN